jgi:hypothetical protein
MHFYILSHQERMENVQAIQEKLLGLGHRVTIVPVSSASHKDAWALVASTEEPQETHIILEDNVGLSGNLEPINPLLAYDAVIMWRHPSYLHIPVVQGSPDSPGYLEYYEQKGMYAYALTPLFAKELMDASIEEPLEPLEIYLGKLGKKVYISEQSPFFIWGHLCDDFFSHSSSSSSSL